jgi:hypothetical protein
MFTKLLFGCIILGIVLWMASPFHLRHKGAALISPAAPIRSTTSPATMPR